MANLRGSYRPCGAEETLGCKGKYGKADTCATVVATEAVDQARIRGEEAALVPLCEDEVCIDDQTGVDEAIIHKETAGQTCTYVKVVAMEPVDQARGKGEVKEVFLLCSADGDVEIDAVGGVTATFQLALTSEHRPVYIFHVGDEMILGVGVLEGLDTDMMEDGAEVTQLVVHGKSELPPEVKPMYSDWFHGCSIKAF
jgi:hypothetical protein